MNEQAQRLSTIALGMIQRCTRYLEIIEVQRKAIAALEKTAVEKVPPVIDFRAQIAALRKEIEETKAVVRRYLQKIDDADEGWLQDQDTLALWAVYTEVQAE